MGGSSFSAARSYGGSSSGMSRSYGSSMRWATQSQVQLSSHNLFSALPGRPACVPAVCIYLSDGCSIPRPSTFSGGAAHLVTDVLLIT